ncbi:M24 family metallopeptidase [Sphingomonas glaciei]|uniref:Xaa-Pro peptidase family protein n=1 Tax=Sphingomonas glaciei TaxID=2938948 RepID=A0ABY5MTR4_9SPHN|nr:Xaa-Pro peptidase family protein [Sphingomonas glaciei]UUR07895.1 Xaa-Pro peptidase family protein [Sphingomonas glaciei]
MTNAAIHRRSFLGGAGALSAALAIPARGLAATVAEQVVRRPLPPPISAAERIARLRRAQQLLRANRLGAMLVESGASLDYYTGIQWWRSERLTGVVIPAEGDPIIVTPFFEQPSIAEQLEVPAEIRTWQEDEEPLKLVADFLRERKVAGQPVAFEETNRFFLGDRLAAQLPATRIVSANAVVRAQRMIKSPAELALMQAASDITIAAFRTAHANLKPGMTGGDISAAIVAASKALGGDADGNLVLINEASALPHGSKKQHTLAPGDLVLIDGGCSVHGYQSDISRTFVFDGKPNAEQRKVWEQVHRGQQIALAAARIGASAGSVDDAVRTAYASWGYGPDYKLPGLSHRTGHGIGMEGHEPVNLVRGETTRLAPGMCFSNEPGLYLPGRFGVRLEDCFHMTPGGPRWFTTPPPSIDQPLS